MIWMPCLSLLLIKIYSTKLPQIFLIVVTLYRKVWFRIWILTNNQSFATSMYDLESCYCKTLWYNCVCCLSRLLIFIWTLVGRGVSSGIDVWSKVITCSTLLKPVSSIIEIHSPLMNISPLIKLYLDILSKVPSVSPLCPGSLLLKKM